MKLRNMLLHRLLTVCTTLAAFPIGAAIPTRAKKTETNLVAGLPYTTETGVGIAYSYGRSGTETDPAEGKLTDGKRAATLAFDDPAWHKCYRGFTRSVTFALPTVKKVTGFSVSLLQNASAGLPMPPSFDLYVSENGTDYMLAASYDTTPLQGVKQTTRREVNARDLGSFRARYVRLTFRCEVNVFIDEVEIYGTDPDGSEAPFVKAEPPQGVGRYDKGIENCRDMVLLYNGYPGEYEDSFVNSTEEMLLPYFAYLSETGEIQDTFFDSVMFTALRGAAPSGGNFNQNGGGQTTKEDWEYFLANLFDETYNCGAIEKVMERVAKATGKNDACVSLVINIPFPNPGDQPFGDIDGSGKPAYCRNSKEQLAIYTWFFDRVEQILSERQYKHIRFGGYYWGAEGIGTETEKQDDAFVRSVADLIHARGSKLFWIPYLYGNGFNRTAELGFDCAMMQPNYSFLDYADERCFGEIDQALKQYGLGIEIEVKWTAMSDDAYLARYYSYLNAGHALGYEWNTAHSYYQNAGPGTFYSFAKSDNRKFRRAYEDTYAFVKGTYQPRTVTLRTRPVSTSEGEAVQGFVGTDAGCYEASLGAWQWKVSKQPEHGIVSFERDGGYTYTPQDGFAGKDSFTVCMQAAYAASEPLTVEIDVLPKEAAPISSVKEPLAPDAPANRKSIWPFALAGGAIALLAAGIAAFRLRSKRKSGRK